MDIIDTDITDVKIFAPKIFEDERGYFFESFRQDKFDELAGSKHFVQDNCSKSTKGVLRGLHYQVNRPQGKLVRVVQGKIFDVAVDLRRSSTTFGQWIGVILSDLNKRSLWVPEGFAHGFLVLSQNTEIEYKCTDYYSPADERTIAWNDVQLGIKWPLLEGELPILSKKDNNGLLFKNSEYFA